jgi:hypothetical protein
MTLFWKEELREAAVVLAFGLVVGWLLLALVYADKNCTIAGALMQVVSPDACQSETLAAPDTLR